MVCEISAEGIAHCLLGISSDPAAQLEMRANARRGAEKYTWARSAGILLEAYKAVERDR
jgi:glycosyltransferase involved in cell wall biosynthesis